MVSDEKMQVGLEKEESDKQVEDKNEQIKTEDKQSEETTTEKVEEPEVVEMVEIPKKRLEELENAEAEALEEIKRERASVINYRKRLEKQRDDFAEIASVRVLSKVLDIEDDVKRILDNGKDSIPKEHLEGIKMMAQRLKNIFEQEGVKLLEVKEGKTRFDPRYHEPILISPNADLPDKTITTVVNAGFVKGERVLRPAKVIITQKPPEPKDSDNESTPEEEKQKTTSDEKSEDNKDQNNKVN